MPKGKHIFGTVKVGERGQIVIPKEAREIFDINPGDTLLVLGDEEQGIAVVKADVMKERILEINPDCQVEVHKCFFLPENADEFHFEDYDYVVDAVDTVTV